jgi:glutamyl-tRNA synthetase
MHLGNARTALLAWLDVRSRGGHMVLRIEDLDRVRCTPQLADGVRRDLAWLGLDWDEETARQSTRDGAYARTVERLAAQGRVFSCFCTRRQLALASAPHDASEAGRPCAGGCRRLASGAEPPDRPAALRVVLPDEQVEVEDRLQSLQSENPGRTVHDMVIRRSDGLYAYQLAVVVDDAADGVTDVLRGADLLSSTARQVALQRLLGLTTPRYAHVPLVLGADGRRLAKRHGAPSVAALRESGRQPEAVIGSLAAALGLSPSGEGVTPGQLVETFSLEAVANPDSITPS